MATSTPSDPLFALRRIASRAATLSERLAAPVTTSGPEGAIPANVDGHAVLRAWRAATGAAEDDQVFAARLSWQGLTPASALAAVSRAIHADGPLPGWTRWLQAAIEEAAHLADDRAAGRIVTPPQAPGIEEPPFVELGLPWLNAARRALAAKTEPETRSVPLEALEAQLLREFGTYAAPALHEAFTHHAAATSAGATNSYGTFVSAMLAGGLIPFFDAYPVVARQLATVTDMWVQSTAEFCARLARDRRDIEITFCAGQPAGSVVAIEPALSDPHDGRRRVAAVRFSGGRRIIYKPRSLEVEEAFFNLLAWARARGLVPGQPTLRLLARDSYGWVESAEEAGGFSHEQAKRYYEQAGGLLCWAYVLRGRDLHMENVVATSDGPILIDLEVLVQPAAADETRFWADASPLPAGSVSCLQSGLLTVLEVRDDGTSTDIGGFRGTAASVGTRRMKVWRHLRTAAVAQVDEPAPPPRLANAVTVEGRRVQPEACADDVLAGFTATYRFIVAQREALLAPDGPLSALTGTRVRVLPRTTDEYAQLMHALTAPKYLVDGAVRSSWLDIFARPYAGLPAPPPAWRVLEVERALMDRLDVPRFWVPADGTTVHCGDEPVMAGYAAAAGLTAVRRLITSLGDDDLAWQRRALRDALAETVETRFTEQIGSPGPAPPPGEPSPLAALRAAALVIGLELLARRGEAGRNPAAEDIRDLALYNGRLGAPVFFAALARTTLEDRWRTAAETAAGPIITAALGNSSRSALLPSIGIGSGIGGLVYGLGLLGRLLEQQAFVDAALAVALAASERTVGTPGQLDLCDGFAGAILAWTNLYALTGERHLLSSAEAFARQLEASEIATECGSVWPVAGGRRYLGFAHGAAGIGTAAFSLAHATGNPQWRALGERAWQSLESSFVPALGNWPLEPVATGGRGAMTAWCHGAPGILIGHCRTLDFGSGSAILTHAGAAMTNLQHVPDHLVEHLCCGNLGRAEALLACGLRQGSAAVVEAARECGRRVVERAAGRQHVRLAAAGFAYPVFDAGFFRGLSGVGYQLLRLAAPSAIPSVLGFE
jgi:type 2 lantibiotic biosynthesis protein LanM